MGGITQPSSGLGIGQSWQNVTASRSIGVTYYNTTGKPIFPQIACAGNGSWNGALTVDSLIASQFYFVASGGTFTFSAVVPNGSSYILASGAAIGVWAELR